MTSRDHLDPLYDRLIRAWDSHRLLRDSDASIPELAQSAARLDDARLAMATWRSHHTHEEA